MLIIQHASNPLGLVCQDCGEPASLETVEESQVTGVLESSSAVYFDAARIGTLSGTPLYIDNPALHNTR